MPVARAIHRIKSCHRESSPRTRFTGIERPVLGRNHDPHVGVSGGRIMGETWFAMSLALGNGCCGATIRRMLALSQCEMVTGPSFSSPNQPDQEPTTAYRDCSGPNSRSDAHCATIVGDWEKPSGETPDSIKEKQIWVIREKKTKAGGNNRKWPSSI